MNKAVFLDRDGTINVDKHYLYKPEDFEFLPGVVDGLRILQDNGFLLIVITNQSGIARGYYTEDDFKALNDYMIGIFEEQSIHITDVFYCPHLPDAKVEKYRVECICRKPKLGMFYEAVEKWDVDLGSSWAIGDRKRDCAICEVTECRGIVISELERFTLKKQLYYCSNMVEAAEIIIENLGEQRA